MINQANHHPQMYSAGRHGCWGFCACGWASRSWTTVIGVHYEFGQHLVEVNHG